MPRNALEDSTEGRRHAAGAGRGTGRSIPLQAAAAGVLAAFVGFSSSFAVIVEGLSTVGATQSQTASGLMAVSVAMGLCAILLSLRTRMPISIAWSTPGGALLAASTAPSEGFAAVIGAFLLAGGLTVLAGLWRPLGRAVASIPGPLANAMLAGVLLPLCLAPVQAVIEFPALGLAIVVTWALVGRLNKLYAMPAAVLVTGILIFATTEITAAELGPLWQAPEFVVPEFSLAAMIGIGLPLFLVTMASQNIPGIAVLKANGYRPEPSPLFSWTGGFSLLAAPFGGHGVNLAAITAAICAGEEAGPDRARRYWSAVIGGAIYVLLGLGAGAATAFIGASPPILIQAVAGLALLGALGASLMAAVSEPGDREPALVTFLVTASSVSVLGVSGAFWGLLAGGALYALQRFRRSKS